MLQVMAENHFGLGGAKSEGNVFADKTSVVSADTTDVLSADTTEVLSADTFPPDFAPPSPKWFSAITCNIWLRLEYRPLDSAWFFGTRFWCFPPQEPLLGLWIPNLDLGGFLLARDLFCQNRGPTNHDFVE